MVFGWLTRRRKTAGFDPDLVPAAIRDFEGMSPAEQQLLVDSASSLSRRLRWEAARGMSLDAEVISTIASRAALLVLGRNEVEYRARTVIVHPTTVVLTSEQAGPASGTLTSGPRHLNGQADDDGTILLSWDTVRDGGREGRWRYDVVLHEFAHSLDIGDGVFNGTPPIGSDSLLDRWASVCTARYDEMQRGDDPGLLRPYAGTNTAEFFAVAVETLFDRPHDLKARDREFFDLLTEVLAVDPSTWSTPPS